MAHLIHPVRYSFREYVRLEEDSTIKHEYFDGRIYAMAGGTPDHSALAAEVGFSIGLAIRSGSCRLHTSDLRIRVLATGLATYPDLSVVCGPRAFDPDDENTVINPTVLVEVTSKSSEEYDRGDKFDHYRQIPSLREYVLVSHHERAIEVRRLDSRGDWTSTVARSGERAVLQSIECMLDVDAIYDRAANPPG